MAAGTPPDIEALELALDSAERDARALVSGLTEEAGTWHAHPASWSMAECLDHIATGAGEGTFQAEGAEKDSAPPVTRAQ